MQHERVMPVKIEYESVKIFLHYCGVETQAGLMMISRGDAQLGRARFTW
jgi:hypothetical protein